MTTTNEALADALEKSLHLIQQVEGEGYLLSGTALNVHVAASRLRSMPTLDGIETSPARTSDPSTSKAAARAISGENARGNLALAFYKDVHYGGSGLTAAEAVRVARLDHLAAPWKRVSELKKAGIVAPTGQKRKGTRGQAQEVLALTGHGKAECERLMPVEVMEITTPKAYGVAP